MTVTVNHLHDRIVKLEAALDRLERFFCRAESSVCGASAQGAAAQSYHMIDPQALLIRDMNPKR